MTKRSGGSVRICHPGIICERLEQRIVLNATVPPPADGNQSSAIQDSSDTANVANSGDPTVGSGPAGGLPEAASNLAQVFENDLHVVLISDALDDIQGISDAAGIDTNVIVYDEDRHNFDTLNTILGQLTTSTGRQIGTLLLFSHGDDGCFSMGTDRINFFNVGSFDTQFAQLSTYLSADAQIQLYACSLASDFFGQSLVYDIASATGADVFASIDTTGGISGNWDLEYASDTQISLNVIIDADEAKSLETELAEQYPAFEDNWAVSWNGALYYAYDDGVHGNELWRSDGTADGTYMVADINVGNGDSDPSQMIVYNGALVFSASDGNSSANNGTELWQSDGTAAGTVLLADINPGNQSSDPGGFVIVNNILFFSASDGNGTGSHGTELWRTDGTLNGTLMVADINPGNQGSDPTELTDFNGVLYFSAFDGIDSDGDDDDDDDDDGDDDDDDDSVIDGSHGRELWRSDGTDVGTELVFDINPGRGDGDPTHLTVVGDTLFFSATDGNSSRDHGTELWSYNETTGVTGMVMDINPGNQSSDPAELTNVNGRLFFSASNGNSSFDNGTELWISDGTLGGTDMVLDINPGNQGSDPGELTNVDGTLYFAADDGTNGIELWSSDGTAGGTGIVLDINSGPGDSTPRFLNNLDGVLIFAADDGIHGYEPWFSDGTPDGTYLLKDINPAGSSFPINFARLNPLFFLADGGNGYELWRSDGTAEGTVRVIGEVPSDSGSDTADSDAGTSSDSTIPDTSDSSGSVFGQSFESGSFRPGYDSSEAGKDRIEDDRATGISVDGRGFTTESVAALSLLGNESQDETQSQNVSKSKADDGARDGLPPQYVPGLIKVIMLADGDYSINLGKISLVIGSNMWLPGMVQWYLSAVCEGSYRYGSLPTDYERMIWDFLAYIERQKAGGDKDPTEMELRLAWQWAEWRRQVLKEHGSKEVLPWDYFQGLSKSLTLFYGKHSPENLDYSIAVNALKHNAANLNIIPVKLPEETLAKSGGTAPIQR